MKKMYLILLAMTAFAVSGCSKSSSGEEPATMTPDGQTPDGENPDPDPMGVTYEADIKGIIQGNCLSCHTNPPQNNAPMSLTTYDDVKNAVETRGLITRINSTSNPMPPTGRLPAATRQLIEEWVDQDFPEN